MGLFNKFEQKRSYLLRKDGNERSPSTPPVTSNNRAARTASRPAHARRTSSAGLNMNGVSCVVNDPKTRRPSLSTSQPTHFKVSALESFDADSSDDSAPSRLSDESEPRSLASSATSNNSFQHERDFHKPKLVDVSSNKSVVDFYDPYNYQSHGAHYSYPQPNRSQSYREGRRQRSRSRPRQHQRNVEDHSSEVVGNHQYASSYSHSNSYNVHADRSISARDMSACSRRHVSPSREPGPKQSTQSMREVSNGNNNNFNNRNSYSQNNIGNEFQRCQNNMQRDMFQNRINNSRSRSRNRAATNSQYDNDMEQRNRLSTGTKMDLAYKAGYEDALERAKNDMLKHFRG